MSYLKLLRIWLLALIVVVVGCGGHDDVDVDVPDAATDGRLDVASDRLGDSVTSDSRDGGGDVLSDVRLDTVTDARVDTTTDARIDTVADVRVDTAVDVRIDSVVDARVDTSDGRIDVAVDARIDTAADIRPDVADVRVDSRIDVTTDPDVDAGCSSDNQCGGMTPHCNTNTGNCVARVAIAVTPANTSIAAGTTQQFAATMTYSDSSTGDVTALATWASSNTPAATMSTVTPGLANGVATGSSTISAVYGGLAAGTQLTVTAAILNSIQITPSGASSPLGTTRQFRAEGTYSDNSTQDLTATATWTSSMPGFATIGAGGLATTVALGTTTITASVGPISDAVNFTVTSPTLNRIDVSPPNATIGTLTTQAYTATGVYSDNSTADLTSQAQTTWSSSDPAIAFLTGTTATGISAGTTSITATFNGVTGTAQLHVTGATLTSIDVTPATPTAQVGFNVQFRAVGHFNDNTTQDLTADVLWGSTQDMVASVSNASGSEGLATGLSVGMSNITASIAGMTGQTTLNVSNSPLTMIEVAPATASIALGTTQSFTATARFMDGTALDVTSQVSWSSSMLSVATVSNAAGTKGRATSVSAGGPLTITASLNGASGSAQLTVNPATLTGIVITPPMGTVIVGSTVGFTATGSYSDGSSQNITALVTWTSMNTTVATIDNAPGMQGVATGVAAGDATIEAAVGATTATATLHVDP